MAALPLTAQASALEPLLNSLASNAAPEAPSIWPLAPGYWLIVILFVALAVSALRWWWRWRRTRPIWRQLKGIEQMDDPHQQLLSLHQFLRALLIRYHGLNANLSDTEFAQRIEQTLPGKTYQWVNAHYQPSLDVNIDWQDIHRVVERWLKEQPR